MKNQWFKRVWPHLLAIIIFLVVAVIFCKPVLDGQVLNQHDIIGWKGSAQNVFDVKEKTGKMPLWNTNVFSGMPNYQISMEGKSVLPDLNKIVGLGLPNPANFFFIACLCFYILCIVLGLNPYIAIAGALAYGFSTYNPIIISVGHETKMMAIAYMPLLMAGLFLIFNKKYWIGLAVSTVGAYLLLMANHPQVAYYFFIVAGAVTISYLFTWIKNKDFKHIALVFALSAMAALVALGCYSLTYLSTKEYAQYTMRGGKTVEIKGDTVMAVGTTGLDHDYAFQYSMKPAETLVMLMPKAFGSSSSETLDENSNIVKKLSALGVPEMSAAQMAVSIPAYWGGMIGPGEGGTSGPPYAGAIIVILAIIGFVIVKHPVKWALLAATILSLMMSWGKYFSGFNNILFDVLPLYNKFRAPSMALIIAQFTLPLMAVITVYYLFFKENAKETLQNNFKKVLYTLGGIVAVLGIIYIGQSYSSGFDQQIMQAQFDQSGTDTINRAVIAGMKDDRQNMFGGQVLRTVLFLSIVLGVLFLFTKNILKPVAAIIVLALICFIDLWAVGKKYLNDEHFVSKDEVQVDSFVKTPVDEQILKDTDPHFRVFDVSRGFNDNHASYYHRSALGYHPAKLRLYQDIIERYFSSSPNEQVLNALDVKYIINQNAQGQVDVMQNPNHYGAVWFVKEILPVANDVEELQAIGKTNLKDTAVVQQSLVQGIGTVTADTTASISLTKYTNDEIEYNSNAASPQFAVFSEVYYPAGWNAYIDGQKADIVKTNYFLRGLKVPAGKHSIKLVFEPETVKKGITLSYISSWLFVLFVLGGFGMQWWMDKKSRTTQSREQKILI